MTFSQTLSKHSILPILQLNCHKSIIPQLNVAKLMLKHSSSLALLQEVNFDSSRKTCTGFSSSFVTYSHHLAPRAAIVYSKSLSRSILPLPQFTNRDMAALLINNPRSRSSKLILCSFYWSHGSDELPSSFIDLVEYANTNNIPIVIGSDSNAHNVYWGSSDTNPRGETLIDFLNSSSLQTMNNSSVPTFHTSNRQEVLDITMVSDRHSYLIKQWKVIQGVSLSDHNLITFKISYPHNILRSFRSIKHTDWDIFNSILTMHSQNLDDIAAIPAMDDRIIHLNELLSHAFNSSCPETYITKNSAVPWWTKELDSQKQNIRILKYKAYPKQRRRGRNGNSGTSIDAILKYKFARNRYTQALRRSQRLSKRSLASSMSVSSFPKVYRSLIKESSRGTPSLLKDDGTYTTGHSDTLEAIVAATTCSSPSSAPSSSPLIVNYNVLSPSDLEIIDHVIQPLILDKVIANLPDFKSPGSDFISGIMIKKAWPLISNIVYSVFRDSLAAGRIPHPWLISRSSLIPKRRLPSTPKEFRVINLSCVLLKALERCVLIYFQDYCKISHSPCQFGFQKGIGTDAALNALLAKLENSMARKKLTLAIFLDLKSAFDNISFQSIDDALNATLSANIINRWVAFYIRNRHVIFKMGDVELMRLILKGCPQGGILSPFLFNLVLDNLLRHLNSLDPDSLQAYADDLVNSFESSSSPQHIIALHTKAQASLDCISSWCQSVGLNINTSKTQLVLFTNKRSPIQIPTLYIYGLPLSLSKTVKYLGVTLDSKLLFNAHFKNVVEAVNTKISILNSFIGRSWGLSPALASWSFNSIIRPACTYGSISWCKKLSYSSYVRRLQKIDNRILKQVCRSKRSHSSYTNYVLTGIAPSNFAVLSSAILSLYRLTASGLLILSATPAYIQEEMNKLQLPHPGHIDLIKPLSNYMRSYSVALLHDYHDALLKSSIFDIGTEPTSLNIFTDGSKSPNHCGAGFIIFRHLNQPIRCKINLADHNSVYQAEVAAIAECANIVDRLSLPFIFTVNIFSDSQSALQSLFADTIKTSSIASCVNALNVLGSRCSVNLYWVQAHIGVKGNEEADRIARTPFHELPDHTCMHLILLSIKPPLSYVKKVLNAAKNDAIVDIVLRDNSSNPLKQYVQYLAGNRSIPRWALSLSISSLSTLTQCLSGQIPLNYYRSKIDPSISPLCSYCSYDIETNQHFLFACPYFQPLRKNLLGSHSISPANIQKVDVKAILSFIVHSDRFS